MAKITIWGAENFMQSEGKSLFTGMILPDEVDRDTCIDAIMMRANEFELLYSDLDFLAAAITMWSKRWQLTFQKWVDGFDAEFSPIDNYDRIEDSKDSRGRELKTTYGRTDSLDVSAYDSSAYSPKNKNTLGGSDTDTEKENSSHYSRIHGNIGVTTSTDVLTKYTDFYKAYNIYELIADCFAAAFCIQVY